MLVQSLSVTHQHDRSVQDFFIELSDLWRQFDAMAHSSCPTCERCVALIYYRDQLHLYELLMRFRPEFESVRSNFAPSYCTHTG